MRVDGDVTGGCGEWSGMQVVKVDGSGGEARNKKIRRRGEAQASDARATLGRSGVRDVYCTVRRGIKISRSGWVGFSGLMLAPRVHSAHGRGRGRRADTAAGLDWTRGLQRDPLRSGEDEHSRQGMDTVKHDEMCQGQGT